MATPPPPPTDPWAGFDALGKEEEAVRAGRAQREAAQTTPQVGTGGWWGYGDPYEALITRAAENPTLNQYFPKGTWRRTIGGLVIPQNMPELAIAALTAPIPGLGTVGRIGAKAGGPLVSQIAKRAGLQALKTGAVAAGVGGLTGHDPVYQGALGAVGGGLGQTVGDVGASALQSQTVQRLLESAGDRFNKVTGALFQTLPGTESAREGLSNILSGDNAQRIEQEMLKLGQRYQTTPKVLYKDPTFHKYATVAAGLAGEAADQVLDPVSGVPKIQGVWKYGGPEARKWLVDKGYVLTGAGEAAQFKQLAKDAQTQRLLQELFTGESGPISDELRDATIQKYFSPDMQEFTAEGLAELGRRLAARRPMLERQLGKETVADLEKALYRDVGTGLQQGVSKESPQFDVNLWKFPKILKVEREGKLPYVPGWEKQAGETGATLSERAKMALTPLLESTAAQAPEKVAKETGVMPPEYSAPPPAAPVPTPEPPAEERPPGSGTPAAPAVEPPPTRPSPPSWFRPELPPAPGPEGGEEMEVNLSTARTP